MIKSLTELKTDFDAAKLDGDKELMRVLKNIEQFFIFGQTQTVYPNPDCGETSIRSREVTAYIFECHKCHKPAWTRLVRGSIFVEECYACNNRSFMRTQKYKDRLKANAERLAQERHCETCRHYTQHKGQTFPQCNTKNLCPRLFPKPETEAQRNRRRMDQSRTWLNYPHHSCSNCKFIHKKTSILYECTNPSYPCGVGDPTEILKGDDYGAIKTQDAERPDGGEPTLTTAQRNQERYTILKVKDWVKCYDQKYRRIVLVVWHYTADDIDSLQHMGNDISYDRIGENREYSTHEELCGRGLNKSEYFRLDDYEGALYNFETRNVGDRGKYKNLSSLIK